MFCDNCGTQLADTASFCNKCGNAIKKQEIQNDIQMQHSLSEKNSSNEAITKKKKGILGVFIALLLIVGIGALVVFFVKESKPSIYGTWSDSERMITFSFMENGELRVSGPYNILGAELFTFTEEDGKFYLQANSKVAGNISFEIGYELVDDTMIVDVMGYTMTLYKVEESDTTGNIFGDIFEDAMDVVQISSLYGTWSDRSGTVSFTFYEDGRIRISGLVDMLNVEMFTFTEVDADTLQLKADTDNALLGMVSVNLDYEILDNTMMVNVAGQSYELIKQD